MNKDNPVASIDDLIEQFAKENPDTMIEIDPWNVLQDFAKFYKSQNAVETNKVQPKECYCGFCKEHIECTKPSHTTGISWGS